MVSVRRSPVVRRPRGRMRVLTSAKPAGHCRGGGARKCRGGVARPLRPIPGHLAGGAVVAGPPPSRCGARRLARHGSLRSARYTGGAAPVRPVDVPAPAGRRRAAVGWPAAWRPGRGGPQPVPRLQPCSSCAAPRRCPTHPAAAPCPAPACPADGAFGIPWCSIAPCAAAARRGSIRTWRGGGGGARSTSPGGGRRRRRRRRPQQ